MAITILGISAYYHDSAAAIVRDGHIVAAAQEERFTRRKHDAAFPHHAAAYCLRAAAVSLAQVDFVVFYDKPLVKFERLIETYLATAPQGLRSWLTAMPTWLKDKLFLKRLLRQELTRLTGGTGRVALPKLLFTEHHQAHAASAFYPSHFARAGVLCLDGVGEWAATSTWIGDRNRLEAQWQLDFPHSLGLLYSAFTYYTGFKVNSGEYKVMGLAPYGEPRYAATILEHLIDLKADGTFRLNLEYFDFATGLTMTAEPFHRLFGGPPRAADSLLTQRDMDLARSIQAVTEEVVLRLVHGMHREFGIDHLCLAGGVALNCVANGRVWRECGLRGLWIQPAAGDAGGALGAALAVWYTYLGRPRGQNRNLTTEPNLDTSTFGSTTPTTPTTPSPLPAAPPDETDAMQGALLGPDYSTAEAMSAVAPFGAVYRRMDDAPLFAELAAHLDDGRVIGWMSGRMEFGPRALGARSIIGDPRNRTMQSTMNLKIKYRESFRPFAPSVLRERVADYFELDCDSPYMLLVAPVVAARRRTMSADEAGLFGIDKLLVPRSDIPAVTHIDYSARIQTVDAVRHPRYYHLLKAFEARTGCGLVVNTSFNVRSEPIVCSPLDAYRCFMRTELDVLVIDNLIFLKADQPLWPEGDEWRTTLAAD